MEFAEWLQQQLEKRGWNQRDLIRHVRLAEYQLSPAHLSRIMTGHRDPNAEVCIGIAHALGLSNEEVFRARGWLPATKSEIDPRAERLAKTLSQMPPASRELTLDAIESMVETAQKLTNIESVLLIP